MSHQHASGCRKPGRLLALLLTVCAETISLGTTVLAADVGSRIERFTLPDIHGRDRSLEEFSDKPILVVAFLGTECPLARLYAPRLQELSEAYASRGVAFLAIDANQQDSLTDMTAFVQHFGIKFPLLKDRDQNVADQFGAIRNPEVFVLDKDRAICYRGRVDDQYGLGTGTGYARAEVKQHELATALDELLAGNKVSQTTTPVTGCLIGRKSKVEPHGEVTYTKHIAGLLENRCVSCHRPGQIGPFALTDFDEVVGWSGMMREVVSESRMPPWSASPEFGHFLNDARLSDAEKKMLFTWIDNGCPQGDPADLPTPRKWTDGWQIPEPDQIVRMEKAYHVPAEGVIPYQTIVLDPGWKEDKWIQAAEVRPGSRAVVHHIIASAVPPGGPQGAHEDAAEGPGQARGRGGRGRLGGTVRASLSSFVPGSVGTIHRPGVAQFVPAGSKITFQMHYTPNGTAQDDQSYIGIVFADPTTVKKRVHGGVAGNMAFVIPPQDGNYEVQSETTFSTDQLLLWMMPHMHLRGKSFRYEARYPDGTSEVLLDVPKYDFNWQITYQLTDPKKMPAGTKLHCTAHFDNSENNLANPDPNNTVRFGPQTWEEMMFGWFGTLSVEDDAHVASAPADQQAAVGDGQ